MKTFILFLLVGSAISVPLKGLHYGNERKISENFKGVLERFRELLLNGDQDKNIPVLDPFKLESYDFEFSSAEISAKIKSSGITLTGVASFDFQNMEFLTSSSELNFDFTLPDLDLDIEKYSLTGKVFGALPIYGSGKTFFKTTNLQFTGKAGVAEGANGVYLTSFDVNIALESVESGITGMLGGGDIDDVINAIIHDLGPDFVAKFSPVLSQIISGPAIEILSKRLEGLSLDELIDLVN